MSTRQDKVNSLLQQLVADYFSAERPDQLTGLVTIKKAEVTADLEHAKIFFSVIGQDEDAVLKILQAHLRPLQKMLGEKLQMKIIPRVAFVPDSSGEYADHINKLLRQIHHDHPPKT